MRNHQEELQCGMKPPNSEHLGLNSPKNKGDKVIVMRAARELLSLFIMDQTDQSDGSHEATASSQPAGGDVANRVEMNTSRELQHRRQSCREAADSSQGQFCCSEHLKVTSPRTRRTSVDTAVHSFLILQHTKISDNSVPPSLCRQFVFPFLFRHVSASVHQPAP